MLKALLECSSLMRLNIVEVVVQSLDSLCKVPLELCGCALKRLGRQQGGHCVALGEVASDFQHALHQLCNMESAVPVGIDDFEHVGPVWR